MIPWGPRRSRAGTTQRPSGFSFLVPYPPAAHARYARRLSTGEERRQRRRRKRSREGGRLGTSGDSSRLIYRPRTPQRGNEHVSLWCSTGTAWLDFGTVHLIQREKRQTSPRSLFYTSGKYLHHHYLPSRAVPIAPIFRHHMAIVTRGRRSVAPGRWYPGHPAERYKEALR